MHKVGSRAIVNLPFFTAMLFLISLHSPTEEEDRRAQELGWASSGARRSSSSAFSHKSAQAIEAGGERDDAAE